MDCKRDAKLRSDCSCRFRSNHTSERRQFEANSRPNYRYKQGYMSYMILNRFSPANSVPKSHSTNDRLYMHISHKFHETKSVFLKYCAGKVQSQKAKLAVKEHSSASRQEISAARTKGTSKTQLNKLSKDLRLEYKLLKKDIFEEESY